MKPVWDADVLEVCYHIGDIISDVCIPTDLHACYLVNLYKDKRDYLNRGNYSGLKFTMQVFEVYECVMRALNQSFVLKPLLFIIVLEALFREFHIGCQWTCCTQMI